MNGTEKTSAHTNICFNYTCIYVVAPAGIVVTASTVRYLKWWHHHHHAHSHSHQIGWAQYIPITHYPLPMAVICNAPTNQRQMQNMHIPLNKLSNMKCMAKMGLLQFEKLIAQSQMFEWKMENSIRWKREKFDFECNFSWRKAFFLVFIDRNFGCSWRMEEFETFRAELANETTISKCKFESHRRWRCKCAKAKGIDIALFHSLPFVCVCVCIRCSFLTLPRALHDCHWKSDRSENWRQTQPNNTHTYSHATRSIPSNAMCELHCCNWKRGRTTTTTTRTKTVKWEVKRGVDIRKSVVYD